MVFWLGAGVVAVPFLGVPIQWKEYALIAIGVLIVLLSAPFGKRPRRTDERSAAYVENKNPAISNQG